MRAYQSKILLRLLIVVFSCAALSGCGLLGFNGLSNLLGSNSFATGETETGGSSGNGEPLSSTEASLFEDGPIDIPVSIAKNDGVNPANVDVEFEILGAQLINGDDHDSRYVTASECSTEAILTFTGNADAVSDPTTNPFVYIYNYTQGTGTTIAVNADGSFASTSICANLEDDITVSTLNADETESSPFYRIIAESNGVTAVILTNAPNLNFAQTIAYDGYGGIYVSTINDDGTSNLARIHANNSSPETVASNMEFLPFDVVATIDGKIWVQDQSIYYNQILPNAAIGDVSTSSVAGSSTTWGLTTPDLYIDTVLTEQTGLDYYFLGNSPGFIELYHAVHSQPVSMNGSDETLNMIVRSRPTDSTPSPHMLRFIIPELVYIKIFTGTEADIYTDYGDPHTLYMLKINDETDSSSLQKIDVEQLIYVNSGLLELSSQTILDGLPETVDQIDASENGDVVVFVDNLNSHGLLNNISVWTATEGVIEINNPLTDNTMYRSAKVSDTGDLVVLCGTPEGESESHNLYFYRPGIDQPGTITLLVGDRETSYCNPGFQDSYAIDHDGNVLFYFIDAVTEDAQLGIIYADQIDRF